MSETERFERRDSFGLFQKSPGAELIERMVGLDIGQLNGWADLEAKFRRRMNADGWARVTKTFEVASSGEACLVAAILSSLNYSHLAQRLLDERGTDFLRLLRPTAGAHRAAVGLVLMLDETPLEWSLPAFPIIGQPAVGQ